MAYGDRADILWTYCQSAGRVRTFKFRSLVSRPRFVHSKHTSHDLRAASQAGDTECRTFEIGYRVVFAVFASDDCPKQCQRAHSICARGRASTWVDLTIRQSRDQGVCESCCQLGQISDFHEIARRSNPRPLNPLLDPKVSRTYDPEPKAQSNAPVLTNADVNLSLAQLDLHLPCPTWAFYQLECLSRILRRELQERREEVFPVPADFELGRHFLTLGSVTN
jgi:hypothetical protein